MRTEGKVNRGIGHGMGAGNWEGSRIGIGHGVGAGDWSRSSIFSSFRLPVKCVLK